MIETPRMLLRTMEEGDRDWFCAQAASAEVMRHLGGPQPRATASARFDYMVGLAAAHGFTFWQMRRRADDAALGICGLKLIDAPGAPEAMRGALEIGWRLERFAWGQGYAREAAAASLAHAFDVVGGGEVYAITNIGNAPSWGLMRRLGMTRHRELEFVDPRFAPPAGDTIVHRIDAAGWGAVRTSAGAPKGR